MPSVDFWQQRFTELGAHSVGPGDTQNDVELEAHRKFFVDGAQPWLSQLHGPVLDFGCGVGRWVSDLPRPYLGLDLTPEHIVFCNKKYQDVPNVEFLLSNNLAGLPDNSFQSVFVCTVLQHIVEPDIQKEIIYHLHRILAPDGIMLAIEWAQGQREFDWCKSLGRKELLPFVVTLVGEVVESGRRHSVWIGKKQRSRLQALVRRWVVR